MEIVLLRYNMEAITLNIKDVEKIEAKNNLLYITLRDKRKIIGYHIKVEQ